MSFGARRARIKVQYLGRVSARGNASVALHNSESVRDLNRAPRSIALGGDQEGELPLLSEFQMSQLSPSASRGVGEATTIEGFTQKSETIGLT